MCLCLSFFYRDIICILFIFTLFSLLFWLCFFHPPPPNLPLFLAPSLSSISQAFGLLKKEAKVLVVGLDNSGKTTLLNNLKLRRAALHEVAPTVGFQVESFELGEIKFTAMDMSGAGTYRSLWETYYADAQAIIFVVDAADKIRMVVARDELEALLAHPDIKNAKAKVTGDGGGAGSSSSSSSSAAAGSAANGIPILFFANKLDTPSALAAADVSVVMGLPAIRDRAWQIQ